MPSLDLGDLPQQKAYAYRHAVPVESEWPIEPAGRSGYRLIHDCRAFHAIERAVFLRAMKAQDNCRRNIIADSMGRANFPTTSHVFTPGHPLFSDATPRIWRVATHRPPPTLFAWRMRSTKLGPIRPGILAETFGRNFECRIVRGVSLELAIAEEHAKHGDRRGKFGVNARRAKRLARIDQWKSEQFARFAVRFLVAKFEREQFSGSGCVGWGGSLLIFERIDTRGRRLTWRHQLVNAQSPYDPLQSHQHPWCRR